MASDGDLLDLLKRYLRQETIDPLRSIGRQLLFGVLGSLLLGVGAVLLAGGALRVLQDWDSLQGTWSFAPYLLVASGLVAAGILALRGISRRTVGS